MAKKYYYIIIVFSLFLFLSVPANSQPNEACQVIQITDSDLDSRDPAVCGNGTGIIFISRADLLNNGHPDQIDLFFADVTDPFNPVFYQITNNPENEASPSISEDCSQIAFESDANLTGGNPGNEDQMFTADISNPNNPIFTQATPDVGNSSIGGSISGDGTKVSFQSNRDYTGMNADGSREYFVFDANNGVNPIGQLTNDPVFDGSIISDPVVDLDGSRVAFSSSENYMPPGTNPNGARQLFLANVQYNPPNLPSSQVFQLTNLNDNDFFTQGATITPNGNHILFASNGNIAGMNANDTTDLFLVNVTNPGAPVFYQLTDSNLFTASTGVINSAATRIAFITDNPQFTNGIEQILSADVTDPNNPKFVQLTSFGPGAELDDLSSPYVFTFIAFESDSDLVGENPDESDEVFIVFSENCGFDLATAIPTLSEWGLIVMASILGIVGFMIARRKRVIA